MISSNVSSTENEVLAADNFCKSKESKKSFQLEACSLIIDNWILRKLLDFIKCAPSAKVPPGCIGSKTLRGEDSISFQI